MEGAHWKHSKNREEQELLFSLGEELPSEILRSNLWKFDEEELQVDFANPDSNNSLSFPLLPSLSLSKHTSIFIDLTLCFAGDF
ncbi:hypothetical protein KP509_01G125800 [Ceratopteris richardii]|uniref:Uncharacterized protein n=1 Tax=Ceratopteris richardii TaxID=49495 RepID=A0A8T2VU25_CERRI|nr:hypothetical protein KP509_01G125800 [Ceratopteris richardii]